MLLDINMEYRNTFFLFQQLKCQARAAILMFNHTNKLEGCSAHLFAYYYKAVDTGDGIIQLYKNNLPECA